jgi:hypothetical protein
MERQNRFDVLTKAVSPSGNHHTVPSQPQNGASLLSDQSDSQKTDLKRSRADEASVILKMQKDLFEHGRKRAIESGALEPNDEDVRTLENHSSAMARDAHRKVYDPAQHAHDQLLDNEYKKNLKDRSEAEQAVKYATAALKEREEEAAGAPVASAPPEQSLLLPAAAVVATMITVAPTLHDFVFLMADDFLSWLLSLLCGLFLGLLIALMILGDVDAGGRRTATNWTGLGAGILLSLALGALRIKEASCFGDYIFALAMTALELGIVLGLEGVAMSRRARYQAWATDKAASDQTSAKLEAARTHLERCKDRLKELNDAISAHISYVEERALRFFHIDEIEASALKAACDGYFQGIAENRGRILGAGGKQL